MMEKVIGMYILIGADIVPTELIEDKFAACEIEEIIGSDLYSVLQNASFRIVNIEAPITDRVNPISKCGPNLRISSRCTAGFKAMRIDLATLANNHIMDQGETGLTDTIDNLKAVNIAFSGAGNDRYTANEPYFFNFNGKRIGIYCCTEHEFSVASDESPGANPFDPYETMGCINHLKSQCDYIIVLYHGGIEQYRYPSPQLRINCKKLVDSGANLVVCQHSHCIGCEEKYNDGQIIYGQGNFLFPYRENEFWNSGLLIKLDNDFRIHYVPIIRTETGIKMATGGDAEKIISGFNNRSIEIKNDKFIEKAYSDFAKNRLAFYLGACYPSNNNIIQRVINKLFHGKLLERKLRKVFKRRNALRLYNYIYCEAHRELFIKALKDYIDNELID